MADNRETSRSDEIFNVLNGLDVNKNEPSLQGDAVAPEASQTPHTSRFDNLDLSGDSLSFDAPSQSSGGLSLDNDPGLGFGNEAAPEYVPESVPETAPESNFAAEELDSIPVSLFGHLSEEGNTAPESTASSGAFSHFTEHVGESIPLPEEAAEEAENENEEDDDEKESSVTKVGKAFQKISAIPKAIIYILCVLIVSAYLSYFVITVGNDVFALVTESREVTVTLTENMTHKDVGKLLKDEGVIEYSWVYELYMKYRSDGDSSSEYIPGEYKVNTDYNYSQLIYALTSSTTKREVVRITIPEGFTIDQIIDLLVSNGVGTREEYVEAINNYPYKWEFVQQLEELGYSEHRKYRLEGYLYPDTYDFYTTEDEVYVINKMLAAFNAKFWQDFNHKGQNGTSYRSEMLEKYNMTFDDIVVLASMVQSEGGTAEDFYYVSHVFHNRLSKPDTFPYLESDATIQYVLPERVDSTELDVNLDTPYNSYTNKGLPPGAISSPGLDALHAALFPTKPLNESGKEFTAYYFVSNNAGKTYYAATLSGHNKNVAQAKKDNEEMKEGNYVDPDADE